MFYFIAFTDELQSIEEEFPKATNWESSKGNTVLCDLKLVVDHGEVRSGYKGLFCRCGRFGGKWNEKSRSQAWQIDMAEIRSLNLVSVWKPVHLLLFIISDHGLYLGKSTIDMEQKRDCQLLETMANAEGEQGRWQWRWWRTKTRFLTTSVVLKWTLNWNPVNCWSIAQLVVKVSRVRKNYYQLARGSL